MIQLQCFWVHNILKEQLLRSDTVYYQIAENNLDQMASSDCVMGFNVSFQLVIVDFGKY